MECPCYWTIAFGVVVVYYVLRYLWELIPIDNLNDKAIVITGCDSGFGRELALKCARKGITVFAGCLTQQGESSLSRNSSSLPLYTVSLDVTSDQSVNKAKDFVQKKLNGKKLWAIVNNAGIFSCYGPDDWLSVDDYQLSLDVNTLGVIRCTQAFKDDIKLSEGRIVTVTSVNGRLSSPAAGPYVVAKFGAEAYMDAIRQELYYYGVKCSILEPGIFLTPLLNKQAMIDRVEKVWGKLSQQRKDEYGEEFKDYFASVWNETYHSMGSTRIDYVVDNYYHAITAKYPRCRYRCGWDSIFFYIPLSYLPTEVIDFVIRMVAKQEVIPRSLHAKLPNHPAVKKRK